MRVLIGLLAAAYLTGCQQIDALTQSIAPETNQPEQAAPVDHSQFLASMYEEDEEDLVFVDVALPHPFYDQSRQVKVDDKAVFGDVWRRIQSKLTFDVPSNRRIAIQQAWYARHPDYLARVAKRAEPFLYFIVEEIEKRDMPMELALLPIVESAFDPFAYSHGRASGLWQFVPGTGERFGLKQDWWYDGRRDVVASTHAALDYMEFLAKKFNGNWLHALAAYNSGEGRVSRAIKKNYRAGENIDYWSLELPKETDAYVPKLLALADMVKRPEHYKINIPTIPNVQVLEQVEAHGQIDLALAAKMADMHINELHALNPAYNRWATSPEGPHSFLLPLEKAETFAAKLQKMPTNELLTWQQYEVKRGDSLSVIAQRFNTSSDVIRTANNIKGNNIRAGQTVLIPNASSDFNHNKLSFNQRVNAVQQKSRGKNKTEYTVKSGDTFWDISRKHKVNVRSLAKWNAMAPGDPIFPGQTLVIWKQDANIAQQQLSEAQLTRKVKYKVRDGDSLSRIADKFSVTIAEIVNWNRLNQRKYLQPGQMLELHVDITRI